MKKSAYNNMEDQFQQHFSNSFTSVDQPEELWADIQQRRKTPKRRFLFWLFAIGLFVISAGSYAYFSNLNIATDHDATVDKQLLNTAAENPNTNSFKANQIQTKEVKLNEIIEETKEETSTTIPTTKSSIPQAVIQIKKIKKTKNAKNINEVPFSNTDAVTILKVESTANERLSTGTINVENVVKTHSVSSVQTIANGTLSFLEVPIPALGMSKKIFTKKKKKKNWDKCQIKKPGRLFLNAYGQASIPIESISEKEGEFGEVSPTYEERWKEKFSPYLSYTAGAQIGFQFPWKAYVSIGLAYQHFQSKHVEKLVVTEQTSVFDEMAYFYIDENGETVWVGETVTVTNVFERDEIYPNNYQLWHIPIQLGYITSKNQFRFGGNIEALINISKNFQGRFLTQDENIIEIDSKNDPGYMSNSIGLSLSAGVHLGYMITDHWEAYFSPRFRFNKQSFLHDSQPLNMNLQFAGIRAGVMHHF